jgi:hypothetical protein
MHYRREREVAMMLAAALAAALCGSARALDNGLALTPPLGWRSFNAFWGIIDQTKMEGTMDAMTNRSRTVGGVATSLLDLGYNHVGLDGGWNYCYPNNKTFHQADGTPVWCDWAKGRPCQGNVSFPNPQGMVDKAKALGLSPGWYLNNCGCNEHQFVGKMVDTIMKGSVKALVDMGWEGLSKPMRPHHTAALARAGALAPPPLPLPASALRSWLAG